ncbi:PREDICTED: uncharacterized protein LOC109350622 [Lupinus angustifolius]|uniref:uncharacterized protein LOC109350622 n=1 Tax=Lupinus angustifolius TaxID=3871 RepID=UPI00092FAA67|nr:PREDICTED: uncharacterized protein LOC109350622 [Lupinus angustifolius]
MVLLETVDNKFWEDLRLKKFVVNNRGSRFPSIWGFCRQDLYPRILVSSDQHIVMVVDVDSKSLFISAVYAHTLYLQRRSLWKEIIKVMRDNPGPWCCLGDFNVVLGAHECRGSRSPATLPMEEFRIFSDMVDLIHLLTTGPYFSWSNRRRGSALTEKRLDRAICNNAWLDMWNQVACCTLTRLASDHHPILLHSSCDSQLRVVHFRFHKMWILNMDYRRLVSQVWRSSVAGCPMFILAQKLRILKNELKAWNISVFGNIHQSVKNVKNKVDDIQNQLNDVGINQSLLDQEVLAQSDLLHVLDMEEVFWKEKARVSWHSQGDRNTAFFHRITKIRQSTKAISMLRNVIPRMVSEVDNLKLTATPDNDEIKVAVFSMNEDGAPGPDGYGVDKIEDFRPTTLANFQFKIISKVLADRLADIAPKLISKHQRGFIKDRKIHDCICIASEAINMLDHKTFRGNLAIKLSINVNGRNVGFFSCTRGVRQGDPLSPLLFYLAEEVLSRGIQKLVNEHKISTITGPHGLATPSHALYAEDVLIFCKGKPKSVHLQPIADKILTKLGTWKGKLISIMGRVELVRSIIQSMLLFSFQIYKWPSQLLSKVDIDIRNFIWSGDIGVRKLVTVAWKMVCTPRQEWGLGLRSIKLINKASILKLAWEMRSSKQDWVFFSRKKYGCHSPHSPRYFNSSIWLGIKENWALSNSNSVWLIGDGNQVNFWKDSWIGDPLVYTLNISQHVHESLTSNVADFISGARWRIPAVLARKAPEIARKIARYIRAEGDDKLIWQHANDGVLTLKTAFKDISSPSQKLFWCKKIWNRSIPPSKSFITWRIMHHKMPTDDNLQSRGCMMASICNLCYCDSEDAEHLFLSCKFAQGIWDWIKTTFSIKLNTASIASILSSCKGIFNNQVNDVLLACVINAISFIWYCRNQRRFKDRIISALHVFSRIKAETNLAGKISSVAAASTNIKELIVLKHFHLSVNLPKAPKIIEVIWEKPKYGWIKVNTDSVAHRSPGHAGGGGLFRDSSGSSFGYFSTYLGIQNAIYAELHSAIKAVNIAFSRGWRNLWLEGDSSMTVDIFNNKTLPPGSYPTFGTDAKNSY